MIVADRFATISLLQVVLFGTSQIDRSFETAGFHVSFSSGNPELLADQLAGSLEGAIVPIGSDTKRDHDPLQELAILVATFPFFTVFNSPPVNSCKGANHAP